LIFKWETMQERGIDHGQYHGQPVPGKMYEVELTNGKTVEVWRADDTKAYFCHGLTFGGKEAPGGAVSPCTGMPVETILEGYYRLSPKAEAKPGDILVWRGLAPETTPHSGVLTDPVFAEGKKYLADGTRLQTKNGFSPEANMRLEQLFEIYGESYNAYRRR
jgi:hypothetical protein